MSEIAFADFQKVNMRTGVITQVDDFPAARKPAWILTVALGDLGTRKSSVQCRNYDKDELVGMQVICVINLPRKSIAGFASEVLVLGVPGRDGQLSLLQPSREAEVGGQVY